MATFIDLKAMFDSVDRRVLGRSLGGRGVSVKLRVRIIKIYEETRNVVRVGDRVGKKFWTEKGVRQGYPLSPLLFNLLIVDMEEGLGRDEVGRVKLERRKLKVLGYADDLVILTEEEEGMRWLMKRTYDE